MSRRRYMTRVCLVILVSLTTVPAEAQWNPNSPRARRDLQANPPKPPRVIPWFEIVEPERWETMNKPFGQPRWGHIGKCGWVGIAEKPPGC
jgi:hypothetical protein